MNKRVKKLARTVGLSVLAAPALLASLNSIAAEKHDYKFKGFIKLTGSFSDYGDGDIDNGILRDFYIPGAIPVDATDPNNTGDGTSESKDFDFQAKETRLGFKSTHELENGDKLSTYIEMDFLLAPGGNERISNSYNPRIRHAFFTYNQWLFGQAWSTFQDVGALPESVDFLAASDGIIFGRQAMVRYTNGPWQIGVENPETTVTPNGGGARIVTDDNGAPDVAVKYTHKDDWGHVAAAVLLRQLAYDDGATSTTESSNGLSITGKIKIGDRDDFKFNLASGSGMGRYAGLNTANGAVVDASGELEAIDSTLYAFAYRHHWNSEWRSSFIISGFSADNDTDLTGTEVTKSVETIQINLLYSPVPKLTFGVGILDATREIENGAEGDLTRLIFSAQYGF